MQTYSDWNPEEWTRKKNPMLEQARPSANLRSPILNFDFTAVRDNGFSTGYRRLPAPVTCSTRAGVIV